MIHKKSLLAASILIVSSLLDVSLPAQEATGLVLKGDACIRAEGFGQLKRATLTLWLQIHKLPGEYNSILHCDGWDQSDWHLLLRANGQLQNSVKGNNPQDARLDVRLQADKNKWRHLAVVYDAPNKLCVVYLDGEQAARIQYTTALPLNLDAFCIGAWNSSERALPGAYRDICIFDAALNAEDIKLLYAGNAPGTKPLAHWRGGQKSQEITDSSGHNRHAKLAKLEPAAERPRRRSKDPLPAPNGPVYKQPIDPEHNPWKERGIPSVYEFAAYYTRKAYDEAWHTRSRTDEYGDVMVKFDNGPEELLFGRRTSYRPVWITQKGEFPLEEIVPRTGDGTKTRPDGTNRFSRARIIKSDEGQIVVQWRYLPSPPADIENPDPTRFVDEYFVISPDKRIIRAFRPGTPRIDDWLDPQNVNVSIIELRSDGVGKSAANETDRKTSLAAMGFRAAEPIPLKSARVAQRPASMPAPVAVWSFDEGRGFSTKEAVSGTASDIVGHTAYWREGVSGTALAFDGWYSCVEMPAAKSPRVGDALTVDAWAALAAYPWNYCPIVQHGDVITSGTGWFLGFTPDGRPTLCVTVGGKRQLLEADQRIERYQWAHITGVVDAAKGTMAIYVDGREAAVKQIPAGEIDSPEEAGVQIAKGPPMKTAWPVRFAVDYQYMIDGALDEIRVFDKALSADQAKAMHEAFDPGKAARGKPDLQQRVLPAGDPDWQTFGAHYTHLKFHSTWDNMFRMSGHPDIVVTFDKSPCRYVLWHGVGYIPMMVTENGRWYSNEFNETWWRGCCEPMSDKKMMFGRVHIVEQSPARVVLRWRYPLSNIYYGIFGEDESEDGWGEWAEWIFTIYPDGSVVKKMRVYESRHHRHEWHESMAIMGPGQHPETVVDKNNTLELVTDDGQIRQYNWKTEPPRGVDYRDTVVHKVNMFADWDPYTIQRFTGGDVYSGERTEYAVFPSWDHWPVSQMPSDGRKSHFSDRASHSSLTHVRWDFSTAFGEKGQYIEKVLLEGLTKQDAEQLLPMARFFLDPPEVQPVDDSFTARYDINQKAYVLTRASADARRLRFDVKASSEQPLVNPAFVVENWGQDETAMILIDGDRPDDSIDIRQGVVRRANGVNALAVWIETSTTEPLQVTME